MDKLKLTPSQKVIFKAALQAAYDGGSRDATFLANSEYSLVDGPAKILKGVMDQHCDPEDAVEKSDEQPIQRSSSRYRESGDGHDEFS